ncbi:hypothetical protein niasHT_006027 [Heterodera trifolii]|uniref:Secreted protein n=1 Tax=Heterodera trifolii TaxID=157864 RepID=A0ABD2M759_9BILA
MNLYRRDLACAVRAHCVVGSPADAQLRCCCYSLRPKPVQQQQNQKQKSTTTTTTTTKKHIFILLDKQKTLFGEKTAGTI